METPPHPPQEASAAGPDDSPDPAQAARKARLFALCLSALGVVYGDIGTSPLYTVSEVFHGQKASAADAAGALGATSLIVWILTLSVGVKYILLVLRADNQGEGGTFALLGLLRQGGSRLLKYLSPALILAAGLLYGEGIITPAISVLSAVEGLKIVTGAFQPYIVPITVGILVGLFSIQRRGTAQVGRIFGPVLLVWFAALSLLGINQILHHPGILAAFNPLCAVEFLVKGGFHGAMLVFGSVLLAVTGCEALFADMGHFGRRPIRITWAALVYPALLLNYLGQGAFVLSGREAPGGHIFYALVPTWGLVPMVALATFATIIASQALISGAFSLTQQAIAMGLFPRLRIVHTSATHEGQIYIGSINWTLMMASSLLVVIFQTSSNLAAAYGFAVSGVMLVTSVSMTAIARLRWRWALWRAIGVFGAFALLELLFFCSASLKVLHGGWVPLKVGAIIYLIMSTWYWGRKYIARRYASIAPACESVARLIEMKRNPCIPQIPRSIVVMSSRPITSAEDSIPPVLHLFWVRLGAIPKHVIFLTVVQENVPYLRVKDRKHFETRNFLFDPAGGSVTAIQASYGYMESPDVRQALTAAKALHQVKVPGDPKRWLVLIGQENLIVSSLDRLRNLRLWFFRFMLRNSVPAHLYFGLGTDTHVTTETVHIPEETLPAGGRE